VEERGIKKYVKQKKRDILTGDVNHLRVDESVVVVEQSARVPTGVAADETVERQRVFGHVDLVHPVEVVRYLSGAAVVAFKPEEEIKKKKSNDKRTGRIGK